MRKDIKITITRAINGDAQALDLVTENVFRSSYNYGAYYLILNRLSKVEYKNNPNAQYILGLISHRLLHLYDKAESLYLSAIKREHSYAMNALADIYRVHGDGERKRQAVQLYQRAAELGNTWAKINYAATLGSDAGGRIALLYEEAVIQGNSLAKIKLADYYLSFAPPDITTITRSVCLYLEAIEEGVRINEHFDDLFNQFIQRAETLINISSTRLLQIEMLSNARKNRSESSKLKDYSEMIEERIQHFTDVVGRAKAGLGHLKEQLSQQRTHASHGLTLHEIDLIRFTVEKLGSKMV